MQYNKTEKLNAPPREPNEAPCTPEQAVELARFCPDETFEKIRILGTWQAAKMIAEAQRMEKQLEQEANRAEEAKAKQSSHISSGWFIFFIVLAALSWLFLR